jgi:hypothetical protein
MYWQWKMQNDRRTLWALVAFIFPFRIPLSLLPPSVVECGNLAAIPIRCILLASRRTILLKYFLGIIGWAGFVPAS